MKNISNYKNLFNKTGIVVLGSSLAVTPLYRLRFYKNRKHFLEPVALNRKLLRERL